jgi:large subunit ribosomal protein L10
VAVAKVLNDFAKGNEKFVITGGAMPGQMMSAKEIAALASLPSREELHREADGHDAGARSPSSSAR